MYLPNHSKRQSAVTTVPSEVSPADDAERRRHRRRSGAWSARLETARGDRVGCIVLDLSPGGAKLVLEKSIAVGDLVTFATERFGMHRGRIAWAAGRRVGLAFIEFGAPEVTAATGLDKPQFLRSRAELLRRMAQTANGGQTVAGLLWAAKGFDDAASRIEAQQRRSDVPSIRREDIMFGRPHLPEAP
jgi:hypothetical protein